MRGHIAVAYALIEKRRSLLEQLRAAIAQAQRIFAVCAVALHGALILHPALMLLVAPKASGIVLDQQVQALEQAAFMGKCL